MRKELKMADIILVMFAGLLVFFIGVLLYLNIFVTGQFRSRIRQSEYTKLSGSVASWEESISRNVTFINNFIVNSSEVIQLNNVQNHNELVYALTDIKSALDDYRSLSYCMENVFFYAEDYGTEGMLISSDGNYIAEKKTGQMVLSEFLESCKSSEKMNCWSVQCMDGIRYLIYVRYYNNCYMGCFNELDPMVDRVMESTDTAVCLVMPEEEPVTDSAAAIPDTSFAANARSFKNPSNGQSFYQISVTGNMVPVIFIELIDRKSETAEINLVRNIMIVVCGGLLVAVILWMTVLERYIYRPIRELVTYIVNADENGRNSRPDNKYFKEIRVIFDAFDRKMQENRNLKIEAYEYTLREQQAKLEYLQIQIRPHFIVNGLNSICAMIDMKRADGAREMSMYLAQYLQSLYQKNADMILLKEELRHVETYLNIQRMRFPGKLEYSCEIDDACSTLLVPPIMVLTFVENNVKYGIDPETRKTKIKVTAVRKENSAEIVIRDHGVGFPEEVFAAAAGGAQIVKNARTCVGITNVITRLKLLYGNQAKIELRNDGGAVVLISIPG